VRGTGHWRKDPKTSPSFEEGAYAPVMRQQNLGYIVEAVTACYKKRCPPRH
jgi:hypothetical protein